MEYKIMSCEACERYTNQKHTNSSAVISIYSPIYSKPRVFSTEDNMIKDVLSLSFIDGDIDVYHYREVPEEGLITESQAKAIYEFCEKWYNKVQILIFQCDGGISRSAGCAAAIMRWFEGDDDLIFKMKSKHPNMYCYNKVLDACRGITSKKVSRILNENNVFKGIKINYVANEIGMIKFKNSCIHKNQNGNYYYDGNLNLEPDPGINVDFKMEHAYEIFEIMGNYWGGWNETPTWNEMYKLAKRWEEIYSAKVVKIDHDIIGFETDRVLSEGEKENLEQEIKNLHGAPCYLRGIPGKENEFEKSRTFQIWWD